MQVSGEVAGPSTLLEWNKASVWLDFQYVDNLTIYGTGRIGGQGSIWWDCKRNRKPVSNQPPSSVSFIAYFLFNTLQNKEPVLKTIEASHWFN